MDDPDCSLEAGAHQETAETTETTEASCDKPDEFEHELSKAEQHFDEYLKNLKVKVEDGSERRMVGRRARDVSGSWIYVCFPCGFFFQSALVLHPEFHLNHFVKFSMT